MTPLNMTPAEAERWAYATGDTDRAALLRQVDDAEERAEEAEVRADRAESAAFDARMGYKR